MVAKSWQGCAFLALRCALEIRPLFPWGCRVFDIGNWSGLGVVEDKSSRGFGMILQRPSRGSGAGVSKSSGNVVIGLS